MSMETRERSEKGGLLFFFHFSRGLLGEQRRTFKDQQTLKENNEEACFIGLVQLLVLSW